MDLFHSLLVPNLMNFSSFLFRNCQLTSRNQKRELEYRQIFSIWISSAALPDFKPWWQVAQVIQSGWSAFSSSTNQPLIIWEDSSQADLINPFWFGTQTPRNPLRALRRMVFLDDLVLAIEVPHRQKKEVVCTFYLQVITNKQREILKRLEQHSAPSGGGRIFHST